MRRMDDAGISTIVGALVLLAVLGIAIVSINAFHVPRQGAALELQARQGAESALHGLAAEMSLGGDAPFSADLPLRAPPAAPPLLAGLIVSPASVSGSVGFDPDATSVRVSHVLDAPAGGVPANDPMRESAGAGLVRIYALGNASAGFPVGSLSLDVGGGYLPPATYRLEVGALLLDRASSEDVVALPGLVAAADGNATHPATSISWRLPVLRGAAGEASGGSVAQVILTPGPVASAGGGQRVHEARIEVDTDLPDAWAAALEGALGARGSVSVVDTTPGRGLVTATVAAPAGAPAGVASVMLDLSLVSYDVALAPGQ